MLYPIISDWWNSKVQSRAVASYNEAIVNMDDSETEEILAQAHEYNQKIAKLATPFADHNQIFGYNDILNISGTGIMGYVTIPVIKVELPIYHGTSDEVLNIAAGHLEGSSLPVGGINTHSVISAHRGLPSSKLFTDLDQLVVGDIFTITVLNEIYTYEIEEILIVLPHEMDKISLISGEDYVTLMTCTPYGVNTHRLLVRAHRIETVYQRSVRVDADAMQVDPMLVVPAFATPLVLLLIVFWCFSGRKSKKLSKSKVYYDFLTRNV